MASTSVEHDSSFATSLYYTEPPQSQRISPSMVSVQISAAKRSPLTRNLPTSLTFDKPLDAVTVLDVKKAIAAKHSKVRIYKALVGLRLNG